MENVAGQLLVCLAVPTVLNPTNNVLQAVPITELPLPEIKTRKRSTTQVYALLSTGVSTFSTSKPLMSHGNQPVWVRMAPLRTRLTGVCTRQSEQPSSPHPAE